MPMPQEAQKHVVALQGPNLVDQAWGAAQPKPPTAQLRVHPAEVGHVRCCAAARARVI